MNIAAYTTFIIKEQNEEIYPIRPLTFVLYSMTYCLHNIHNIYSKIDSIYSGWCVCVCVEGMNVPKKNHSFPNINNTRSPYNLKTHKHSIVIG